MDYLAVAQGLALPFLGTTLGAALVFFLKREIPPKLQKALMGFAAGVMIAAAFWGLLNPAIEEASEMGGLAFVPAAVGFLAGMGFLLLIDMLTPHTHLDLQDEGPRCGLKRSTKLVLAVTIHNVPEGMAVGIVFADWLAGGGVSQAGALALAIGIAIQNFPEGAIVSMPLLAEGVPKGRTFGLGVLTGAVEPVAAFVTILAAGLLAPAMPYLLAFAAGAMVYVVIEELVPEISGGMRTKVGTIAFALGFVLMMVLDVTLG